MLPNVSRARRLVVITTRWRIPGLEMSEILDLKPLSPDEGAQLLQKYRLTSKPRQHLFFVPSPRVVDKERARRNEFRSASREFAGHPLALILLASYLLRRHNGNLALRNLVQAVPKGQETDCHRHARRIISSYDAMMFPPNSNDPRSKSCRQLLGVIGLYDRPVTQGILKSYAETPLLTLPTV